MTLTAKHETDNLRNSSHLAVLYATVDVGRESFNFYAPAYPMGLLQRVGNKLFYKLPMRPLVLEGGITPKAITMGFNESVTFHF